MLAIVKAAFPKLSFEFESSRSDLDCNGEASAGDELACEWQRVLKTSKALEDFESAPEEKLRALYKVSI